MAMPPAPASALPIGGVDVCVRHAHGARVLRGPVRCAARLGTWPAQVPMAAAHAQRIPHLQIPHLAVDCVEEGVNTVIACVPAVNRRLVIVRCGRRWRGRCACVATKEGGTYFLAMLLLLHVVVGA